MALNKAPLEEWKTVLNTEVSGLRHHSGYRIYSGRLPVGKRLELKADPSNIHDRYAVRVCLDGIQIGWVPKGRNQELASDLSKGKQARAFVTSHVESQMYLTIRIELLEPSETKPGLPTIAKFGEPSGYPDGFKRFKALPVGTILRCSSREARVSISLEDDQGDVAWFRKADVDDEAVRQVDRGHLWAQVLTINPTTCALFHTSRIPPLPVPNSPKTQSTTQKENTMTISNLLTTAIETNKIAATQAGYLEAGRIANNQLVKVAGKSLPMLARGYADTPVGKLVMANIAMMAASQLRPGDATLNRLTQAMATAAYQEVIQKVDIEGMLNGLMASPEIQKAIATLPPSQQELETRAAEAIAAASAGRAANRNAE